MAAAEAVCRHCATGLPAGGAEGEFCCHGCRIAFALIQGHGLGDFYRLRTLAAIPVQAPTSDLSGERDALAAEVMARPDGTSEVRWHVVGMQCAACVWLIEQLPRLATGVLGARVNIASGRLTVIFDPACITPVEQCRLLAQLGYPARPFCQAEAAQRAHWRSMILRLAVASASALGAMHLSLNLYAGELTRDLDDASARWFSLCAMAVALPGLTYGAAPFYAAAWQALRHRRITMDVGATLVIAAGVLASVLNLMRGTREIYVDALTMFVALLLAGRMAVVAAYARVADSTESLDRLLPLIARRVRDDGSTEGVPARTVRTGDLLEVAHGEVVPCDGILQGEAIRIDAAALSGESRPVVVAGGDPLYAGTTCLSSRLRLQVTAVGAATRMGRVLAALGDASARPTRMVRLADRLQGGQIIAVTALALATIAGYALSDSRHGLIQGIDRAIAVILVSCPCALGLATPLVQALAVGRAARRGILIRDADILEALGAWDGGTQRVRHLVVDKTGTLTSGQLRVVAWQWLPGLQAIPHSWVRAAVMAAEQRSQHPLAVALGALAAGEEAVAIDEWREVAGQGVVCRTRHGVLRIGNQVHTGIACPPFRTDGEVDTVIAVTLDGVAIARIACADAIRSGAQGVLERLMAAGVSVHCCSGDDARVALAVGQQLCIRPERIHGGMGPEDKAALVTRLAGSGVVAVIGDGINDAAALARADVAIGLRGGVEAAIASCQVFIARADSWEAVNELMRGAAHARSSIRTILAVSLLYNALGIVLAMIGVWGPYLCAVAMPASSLTAIALAVAGHAFTASRPPGRKDVGNGATARAGVGAPR